ncbi:MAG: hypothetical protein K6U89_08160 [Chloroflexi bacterium]|nr:hypothetical protein [Chloroflexota bacterium]GIW09457.1 MAG: hypothetical protein KatS3mg061_0514 [Dehalococcoidia bacterium]
MRCPSCDSALGEETTNCPGCGASFPSRLPVLSQRPAPPALRPWAGVPALVRPLLPLVGGVAALAITASLAAAGLRWRLPPLLGRREGGGEPLIEIDEAIVIRTRTTHIHWR